MKKSLIFLGIDNDSAILLSRPHIECFDVRISLKGDGIFLEGSEVLQAFEAMRLIFGNKVMFLDSLNECIIAILRENKKKVTTAESCTGGLLAYQFTSISGASDVYDGGIISYANDIKHRILGVSEENLKRYGAVSEVVVSEMLIGVLKVFGADYAIATSGIAGPGGGSIEKPVGTIFIGVQKLGEFPVIERYLFGGSREEIQKTSSQKALELLAKIL
ncbi:CinA family protein [Helicobacter cappadocius]|uniref:CinA family protein n=1 Tax=Helicobacter cappadocius TaxID=3063998 RepID=A0AA90Q264_9HELI|nr:MULTISPECIES: CinA family protein [unclassified Helicobacter]MDO7252800.1 CinA family protein [Helicobacter sp. faydin-H75]MDP2538843.1 CinA family protein [Helicobacter sp. faydin-H76]